MASTMVREQIVSRVISRITLLASRLTLLLLVAGCTTVGPDYIPPEVSTPPQWTAELEGGLTAKRVDTQALANWWTTLHDPILSDLIERAVAGNLDVKEARARIREARARRGVSQADRFPTIDTTGSASQNRSSEEAGSGETRELYAVGFDASWELDLFGSVRRSVEAAEADLQASKEDLRDVLVSLLAEVALNYVEVRSFQTRVSITEANLNKQEETYNITQWRFQAGLTTQLDVEQAKYNLEQTRSQIPTLQTKLEQARNRLAVLLGQHPGFLNDALAGKKAIPVAPFEVAVGVPADVLRRRPDVRRAERRLAAQTAQVGVATAQLYPKLSLMGSIGLEALSLGNLFSSGAQTSAIASNIGWTMFDAGRIRQNIKVQTALQEQALIQYEAAVLGALEEVENALVAFVDEQARRRSLAEAAQAAQRAVDFAQSQYSSGVVDFSNVLDAERSMLLLQDQLAISEGEVTSNLITLYKALGGGWPSLAPDAKK
jgi:NodT family efflux transporter outer membrane factor (OMF) lipoprotein